MSDPNHRVDRSAATNTVPTKRSSNILQSDSFGAPYGDEGITSYYGMPSALKSELKRNKPKLVQLLLFLADSVERTPSLGSIRSRLRVEVGEAWGVFCAMGSDLLWLEGGFGYGDGGW